LQPLAQLQAQLSPQLQLSPQQQPRASGVAALTGLQPQPDARRSLLAWFSVLLLFSMGFLRGVGRCARVHLC
jgi:hypothetical protein